MKIYVVMYHDPYEHSECEGDCCGADSSELILTAPTKDVAELALKNYISKHTYYHRDDFKIEEAPFFTKESLTLEEL